jgi:hypothetical protein
MINQVFCPLSGNSDVILVERTRAANLVDLYARSLKIDVAFELRPCTEIGYYHCTESDLRFFFPAVVGSAAFYGQLQPYDWYYLQDKNEYEYTSQYVGPSDWVLGIGCGKGAFRQRIPTQQYMVINVKHSSAWRQLKFPDAWAGFSIGTTISD